MATKHTCGGPVFGRKIPGCPRCDELLAGADPIKWKPAQRVVDNGLRAHFANPNHGKPGDRCYPVCTAFDY